MASCSEGATTTTAPETAAAATGAAPATTPAHPGVSSGSGDMAGRLDEIAAAVSAWAESTDVAAAHRAAEEARNLVVGPAGPYFGDADEDGLVAGRRALGLLPGLEGEPAVAGPLNACIERDVLGGVWDDPAVRWQILDDAITAWTPSANTFPSLPSHPMRIIGWATLTLASGDLDAAHEYAGHARLHVAVSVRALTECS